ncbi:ubiquitin-specific protease ESD4 [Trifolium repens]|nr:ubiquitin-specific protease ESD4 [Trifolium repens]
MLWSDVEMYIPMNDQGRHWYLMMVDFTERKLVWLDSLHCNERDPFLRRAILYMALKIEEIMTHPSFEKDITPCCPDLMVSSFAVYIPRHVQQQRPLSNDCGVWICKWMIECPFKSDYGHLTVNTATRMKMALLLVRSANNIIKDEVVAKAIKHWEFERQKRDCLVKFDAV